MQEANILEGLWEEVRAHDAELQGRRVRLIILPDEAEQATHAKSVGRELVAYLRQIGFIGEWADREDIGDSTEYVQTLRQQEEARGG
jgi:hypothetical protein